MRELEEYFKLLLKTVSPKALLIMLQRKVVHTDVTRLGRYNDGELGIFILLLMAYSISK